MKADSRLNVDLPLPHRQRKLQRIARDTLSLRQQMFDLYSANSTTSRHLGDLQSASSLDQYSGIRSICPEPFTCLNWLHNAVVYPCIRSIRPKRFRYTETLIRLDKLPPCLAQQIRQYRSGKPTGPGFTPELKIHTSTDPNPC